MVYILSNFYYKGIYKYTSYNYYLHFVYLYHCPACFPWKNSQHARLTLHRRGNFSGAVAGLQDLLFRLFDPSVYYICNTLQQWNLGAEPQYPTYSPGYLLSNYTTATWGSSWDAITFSHLRAASVATVRVIAKVSIILLSTMSSVQVFIYRSIFMPVWPVFYHCKPYIVTSLDGIKLQTALLFHMYL